MINPKMLKLGKLAARRDPRTLKMAAYFKDLPPPPDQFDVDEVLPGAEVPLQMYANDAHGDCVIAGRAHFTNRLELAEQGQPISITDAEVLAEYFKESGGADSGLNILDSLNAWRQGWQAAGRQYGIAAYGRINVENTEHVKNAVALLKGVYVGLTLPGTAQDQLQNGEIWRIDRRGDWQPGSWGGHCVYIPAYDPEGLTCVTWGQRQKMSWQFFEFYCDECFAVVDALDPWITKPGLDINALENDLNAVTG